MVFFKRIRDRRGFFPNQDDGSASTPQTPDVPDVEDVEPRIVDAWFSRRQKDLQQQRSAPVDVDNLSAWEINEGRTSRRKISPDQMSSNYSLAMSDNTPIISNRQPGASIASLASLASSSIKEDSIKEESSSEVETVRFRDYFDPNRWQGKLLIGLIVFLLVSLAVIVLTAVITVKSKTSSTLTDSPISVPPTTIAPTTDPSIQQQQPSSTPSIPPSESPTQAPTKSLDELSDSLQLVNAFFGVQVGETFGSALSLSGDGRVLAVGAPTYTEKGLQEIGRVQVYENTNGMWTRRGDPILGRGIEDGAGSAVSLNKDGSVLALSEPRQNNGGNQQAGSVRIFKYNPITKNYDLPLGRDLQGSTDLALFGSSLALSPSGMKLVVGSSLHTDNIRFQGQVSVYQYMAMINRWRLLGEPIDGTGDAAWFGTSVALYEDEDIFAIAAGGPHDSVSRGYVKTYVLNNTVSDSVEWIQIGRQMTNGELFVDNAGFKDENYGLFLSLTKTDDSVLRLAVGAPLKTHPVTGTEQAGVTVVYDYNNDWEIVGEPIFYSDNTSDRFGYSVKLVKNGNLLLVGAPGDASSAGSVRIFGYHNGGFVASDSIPATLQGKLPGEDFGWALDAQLRDDKLVVAVGALRDSENNGEPGYVNILEEP